MSPLKIQRVIGVSVVVLLAVLTLMPAAYAAPGGGERPGKPGQGQLPKGGDQDKGKPAKQPKKPVHTWSVGWVERTVAAGASTTVKVTFTSNIDLTNVEFRLSEDLAAGYATVSPATVATVAADVPVELTLTLTAPAVNAKTTGGVLMARTAQRSLGRPLHIKVRLPKATQAP
jgi:hypothetical protein